MSTDTHGADVYRDTQRRTLLKTATWRVVATSTTIALVWIFTGELAAAATVGGAEFIAKMIIYYFHERAWDLSSFGKSTKPKSGNIILHESDVSSAERQEEAEHRVATVWLTGLPGAGKTTLAYALERALFDRGVRAMVLDGENLRLGLNKDLGFTPLDRSENCRRAAEVAKLVNGTGDVAICALISPRAEQRAGAREIIGDERFTEIHLAGDSDVFIERSRLGQLAAHGQIKHFTGVDGPYEAPDEPALELRTDQTPVEECVDRILKLLEPAGQQA